MGGLGYKKRPDLDPFIFWAKKKGPFNIRAFKNRPKPYFFTGQVNQAG